MWVNPIGHVLGFKMGVVPCVCVCQGLSLLTRGLQLTRYSELQYPPHTHTPAPEREGRVTWKPEGWQLPKILHVL